jgi:hypothetical protein
MQTTKTILSKTKKVLLAISLLVVLAVPGYALAASSDCQGATDPASLNKCVKNNKLVTDLNELVNFLSAGVGIFVTATIIIGGIQYSMAGDNAEAVTKAKHRIMNGLVALVAFLLAYAFLQWLIPGGVFS